MANFNTCQKVAFKVNPWGLGFVYGTGTITKPGDRVSTIFVESVTGTFIEEKKELILSNKMIVNWPEV